MFAAVRPASQRDAAIDVVRTLCIISMTTAHLAASSPAFRGTHLLRWFDGAMGFVLLAGFVVGIVQRKTAERVSTRAAQIKALRRARVVYVAHIFICVVAFLVAGLNVRQDSTYASLADFDAWWQAVGALLSLQINPKNAAILSLYVILLLLTPLATALFRRGWIVVFAAGVLALYVTGLLAPEVFTLPRVPGDVGQINWATWQALYFAAFAVGWNWPRVRPVVSKRSVWVSLLVVTAIVGVIAQIHRQVLPEGPLLSGITWFFLDRTMGPGTIAYAFVVVGALYGALSPLATRWPRVASEAGRLGRRSLDCYVFLCLLVLVVPLVWVYDTRGVAAMVYVVVALGLMWAWCWIRDLRDARRRVTGAPAPTPAAVTDRA